jgi:hypothetical protein
VAVTLHEPVPEVTDTTPLELMVHADEEPTDHVTCSPDDPPLVDRLMDAPNIPDDDPVMDNAD